MNIRQARKVLFRIAGHGVYRDGKWIEVDNGHTIARMRRRLRALRRLRRKLAKNRLNDDGVPF